MGNNLFETNFVWILGLLIAVAVLAGFLKIYPSAVAWSEFGKVQSVIAAAERAKADGGGSYAAASGAITQAGNRKMYNQLGGNIGDIANWDYECAAGAGQTLTITTDPYQSSVVAELIADKTTNNLAPFQAVANGDNSVTISRAGISCQ